MPAASVRAAASAPDPRARLLLRARGSRDPPSGAWQSALFEIASSGSARQPHVIALPIAAAVNAAVRSSIRPPRRTCSLRGRSAIPAIPPTATMRPMVPSTHRRCRLFGRAFSARGPEVDVRLRRVSPYRQRAARRVPARRRLSSAAPRLLALAALLLPTTGCSRPLSRRRRGGASIAWFRSGDDTRSRLGAGDCLSHGAGLPDATRPFRTRRHALGGAGRRRDARLLARCDAPVRVLLYGAPQDETTASTPQDLEGEARAMRATARRVCAARWPAIASTAPLGTDCDDPASTRGLLVQKEKRTRDAPARRLAALAVL